MLVFYKLQNANSFKDTAKVLRMTRAGVAWMATGCARGAYESALAYTKTREQFGKPIASFQMIQGHLMEMLSNLTAMQTMVFRLSEMQDEEILKDEHASLAKVFCTMRTRDVVSRAREVLGGNGIFWNTMSQDLLPMQKLFTLMKAQKKLIR